MISEIKLIIFASAIYYLLYHFDIFKIVDSIMKGQDKNIIFFSKIILVLTCIYILKKLSKNLRKKNELLEGMTEVECPRTINGMTSLISEYKDKPEDLLKILNNCKDTLETYNMYEPTNDQCQKYMNSNIPDDKNSLIVLLNNILKCVKIRLIVKSDCEKKPDQNKCLVDFIITNLPKVKGNNNIDKTEEEIITILEQETKNDQTVNDIKMIHSLIDNLIFATNQDINKIEGYLTTLIIKGESSKLLHEIEIEKLKLIKDKIRL